MRILLSLKLIVVALVWGWASVSADDKAGADYHSRADVMADVDTALAQARRERKLLLLALGANWCHDSRGFADKIKKPGMADLLDRHYVHLLINVGNYNEGIEVALRFGRPTIFSTPTVLIIDPDTERQLNADTMHRWAFAYSLEPQEMTDLLMQPVTNKGRADQVYTAAQQQAFTVIDAFEQRAAKRIILGYQLLSPLMTADENGAEVNVRDFWRPLAKMRFALMADLKKLRQRVRDHKGGAEIVLDLPTYAPLPWEKAPTEKTSES